MRKCCCLKSMVLNFQSLLKILSRECFFYTLNMPGSLVFFWIEFFLLPEICRKIFIQIFFYVQLTRAYFAFLEVLFNSHIVYILNLDTTTFMHIVGSLESGLKGLDTSISSQVRVLPSSMGRGTLLSLSACLKFLTPIVVRK